ncbi:MULTISPECIES: septum site-determining protein MinC [Legionella]|uniref:Probable septum site-determining protein MinC n=1 Tax=Legionella maceachernii TaxID=466 RepID=A0A0W0VTL4_9GAMM|nr:septum site-determining protein MinC [Legionella maceachernii]KTD23495.1 septum site determining protein MinC [Legionella maceachernii]SJZ70347.1 septum site-determining protein MinC [Legionella maceachernii]SUP02281.1 Septum site-determining protein MinC [Legionella maceachernii]
MTDNVLKSQAFKLKGRLYTFTVLQLLNHDRVLFAQQLDEMILKAPRFFDKTPIILDCSALQEVDFDLQAFCQSMREHNLIPVAVQGASPFLETVAQCQGLGVLHTSSTQDKDLIENEVEEQTTTPVEIKSKLLTTPVRSGQQVVSKGGDLVITASVSHGAELLADGNIHVYGALRGRALAGISGDKQARIFCQSLEAELVSIAGYYRLSDAIEPHQGPCQIYLQDEHIHIEPLC